MEVELNKVTMFMNPDEKSIIRLSYSGNKTVTAGKFTASERFDINVAWEDMPAEVKMAMERFAGITLLPEINRITETLTSEQ